MTKETYNIPQPELGATATYYYANGAFVLNNKLYFLASTSTNSHFYEKMMEFDLISKIFTDTSKNNFNFSNSYLFYTLYTMSCRYSMEGEQIDYGSTGNEEQTYPTRFFELNGILYAVAYSNLGSVNHLFRVVDYIRPLDSTNKSFGKFTLSEVPCLYYRKDIYLQAGSNIITKQEYIENLSIKVVGNVELTDNVYTVTEDSVVEIRTSFNPDTLMASTPYIIKQK